MVPVIYILTLPAVDLPVYHTVQVTCTGYLYTPNPLGICQFWICQFFDVDIFIEF
jgi:hypothetical protein